MKNLVAVRHLELERKWMFTIPRSTMTHNASVHQISTHAVGRCIAELLMI